MQMTVDDKKWPLLCYKVLRPFSLLLFSFLFSDVVFSQGISLSLNKAPLENAFRAIESKVEQRFVYTTEMFENCHPVTINMKDASLQTVLDKIFEDQPLDYSLNEKFIKVSYKTALPVQKGIDIQGQVTADSGEPLVGTTLTVKGTNQVTITDNEGKFYLKNVNENAVLVVTNIGYTSTEIPIKGKTNLNIRLSSVTTSLDETVVIAYGTTTRRLNTGDVSKVSSVEIEKQPVTNPIAALQGRVPGLLISQTSGVSGSLFKMEIRGQSVLDFSLSHNDPLIIVDGVPFEAGNVATNQLLTAANNPISISQGGLSPLNTINPSDIESIQVLKDADATAIYGSRGANGVILITTKAAKPAQTSFTVNFYNGFSKAPSTMRLLNTKEYLEMRREGFANEGQVPDASTAPDLFLWDTTRYTDFRKLLIGNTAHTNSLQASISGGNTLTQFRLAANYHRETSVFGSNFKDEIAGSRLYVNHSSKNGKLNIQASTNYSTDKNNLAQFDLTRFINLPPNLKLWDSAGELAWDEGGVSFSSVNFDFTNPLAELNKQYKSENSNLAGNVTLSYELFKELEFKTSAGYNRFATEEVSINPSTSIDPTLGQLPYSNFAHSLQKSWILEPQLLFRKELNKTNLSFLLGSTFQYKQLSSQVISATDYNSDLLLNSIRAAGNITAFNNESDYRYSALFGRLHFDWQKRYVMNFTGRRDGSSRFAPERRFSNFGSVGAAWIFSNEKWLKIPFISFGKLRGSYGVTGNDQIGDYRFLNLWTNTSQPYGGVPGVYPKNLYNPTYNWEKNNKMEVALEIGLLNDRIEMSAAYYSNRSSNQLINYTLPNQTGFSNVVQNLPALVQNSGWEAVISASPVKNNKWNWNSSFNISIPKNKLVSFPGLASSSYSSAYVEGASLNSIWKLKYLGVDPATGTYTFEDVDKDGNWTEMDYQLLGNLDPKFYGGFLNNVSYKGLSLSFFVEFKKQIGSNYLSQLSNNVPGTIYNQPDLVLGRWQKPGDITKVERFSSDPYGAAYLGLAYLSLSNGIYSDASYLRLKNAALSFQLPDKWLQKSHLSNAKLYVEGQNLLTMTNYKGTDPESQNFYVLPPLRTIAFGIQLTF